MATSSFLRVSIYVDDDNYENGQIKSQHVIVEIGSENNSYRTILSGITYDLIKASQRIESIISDGENQLGRIVSSHAVFVMGTTQLDHTIDHDRDFNAAINILREGASSLRSDGARPKFTNLVLLDGGICCLNLESSVL